MMGLGLQKIRKAALLVLAVGLLMPAAGRAFAAQDAGATASPTKSEQALQTAGEKSVPDGTVPEKKKETEDENAEYRHSPAVTKFGAMLGMKPEAAATAFTIFNFAVLVFAVGYFLLKTLPKTFRNRSTAIQKNLVDARTATEEATARLSSVEERLSKLDEQIAGMKTQSEKDAVREGERLKAALEEEKQKIVAAAEQEIASAGATARRDLQQYAAELAIEHAARKLIVTAETDRLLVEGFAHKLGADFDGSGGQN